MKMGKFKVNSKTGILFCFVLLESVSGLPFEKTDDVDGKTVGDDSVEFSEDSPSHLTRREIHYSEDGAFEVETSDEASAPIESRFGFHGRGRKSKPIGRNYGYPSFQGGAGKFPFFAITTTGDYPHFPFHYGHHQPSFGSGFLEYGNGYQGFEPWNNGHGNKYGHGHHHDFGYNSGHNHHLGCGPHPAPEGFGPNHDHGYHNGFENHPWKKPGYDYKPPSGFDGGRPNANGPWDGGFISKVETTTTTQKTTTLPQIDVRLGV